jgi:cytochrome P450
MPTVASLPRELYFIAPPTWDKQVSSWRVTRYGGVREVLTAPGLSAEYVTAEEREQHTPLMSGPQAADGDRHRRMRAAMADRFSPAAVDRLRPMITGIAQDLADQLADAKGPTDLGAAFARPLPAQVICAILGLDQQVAGQVWDWIETDLFSAPATSMVGPQADQWAFWRQLLSERRRQPPGPGLLDELATNPTLDDHDVIGLLAILMHAGMATTTAVLTDAIAHLDASGLLAGGVDHAAVPAIIRETLRRTPPFPFARRRAPEDLKIDGQPIPAGQWVTGSLLAAHHNPDRWPDPHQFRLDRPPDVEDLAFGRGVHRCPGVTLAMVELEVGLQALLGIDGLRVDPAATLARPWPSYLPMLTELPVIVGPSR